MTGGPWTRSIKVVHGPGPKWGSMDPWSMFCPHPFLTRLAEQGYPHNLAETILAELLFESRNAAL